MESAYTMTTAVLLSVELWGGRGLPLRTAHFADLTRLMVFFATQRIPVCAGNKPIDGSCFRPDMGQCDSGAAISTRR